VIKNYCGEIFSNDDITEFYNLINKEVIKIDLLEQHDDIKRILNINSKNIILIGEDNKIIISPY
jgi:hypothetical protein